MAVADTDGDGMLDADEHVRWTGSLMNLPEADAREIHRRLDTDGDGFITAQDLLRAIHDCPWPRLATINGGASDPGHLLDKTWPDTHPWYASQRTLHPAPLVIFPPGHPVSLSRGERLLFV
jgi:EF hand